MHLSCLIFKVTLEGRSSDYPCFSEGKMEAQSDAKPYIQDQGATGPQESNNLRESESHHLDDAGTPACPLPLRYVHTRARYAGVSAGSPETCAERTVWEHESSHFTDKEIELRRCTRPFQGSIPRVLLGPPQVSATHRPPQSCAWWE